MLAPRRRCCHRHSPHHKSTGRRSRREGGCGISSVSARLKFKRRAWLYWISHHLRPGHLRLGHELERFVNAKGYCYPGLERLIGKLRWEAKSLGDRLGELQAAACSRPRTVDLPTEDFCPTGGTELCTPSRRPTTTGITSSTSTKPRPRADDQDRFFIRSATLLIGF